MMLLMKRSNSMKKKDTQITVKLTTAVIQTLRVRPVLTRKIKVGSPELRKPLRSSHRILGQGCVSIVTNITNTLDPTISTSI